jgi:hypothetical protein
MNSQDILRNLRIGFDLELDNSETYDYEIAGFDNDFDPKVLDFSNPLVLPVGVLNDLRNDRTDRPLIKLCEIDNRPNDPNYLYYGLEQIFDYDEFTNHFNIRDEEGNILHDYEDFILNNDVFTYTGYTNEIHYFRICEYPLIPPTSTPEPTSTSEPTSTPNPTNDPTPTPTETPTPTGTPEPTSTPAPTATSSSYSSMFVWGVGGIGTIYNSSYLTCQALDCLGVSCFASNTTTVYFNNPTPQVGDIVYLNSGLTIQANSNTWWGGTYFVNYNISDPSLNAAYKVVDGVVTEIVDCSSLPTPTETPSPTATEVINSITLAYVYSLGMGSLSFSGMTTSELGDATCSALAANYQTQTYYGNTLGLGTQFTNPNGQDSNQFWVTNQYYGTPQGLLWVVGSTEYIIETDVNGVVVRYEPFIVQCTPTPTNTPIPTSTETPTPTPTPTVTLPIIPFYQVNNNAYDLSVIRVEGPANTFGTSTAWEDIYELQFNRQMVLGPNSENVYGIIPYNAGVIDGEGLWQSLTTSSTIELVGMPSNPYNPSAGYDSTGNSVKIQLTSAPSYNGSICTIRNFTIVESSGYGLEMGRVYKFSGTF